jgi:hypothetical protein
MLPGYRDPYSSRPLTRGEIGCFLSHYSVWKEVSNAYLEVWFSNEEKRKWDFAGELGQMQSEPMTARNALKSCSCFCFLLVQGQQQRDEEGSLGATWDDNRGSYPHPRTLTFVSSFSSLIGMPKSHTKVLLGGLEGIWTPFYPRENY